MFCFFGFVISALVFLRHWATVGFVTLVFLGRALGACYIISLGFVFMFYLRFDIHFGLFWEEDCYS